MCFNLNTSFITGETYWEERGFGSCCCCSVAQSCLTICNPMDCSSPGLSFRRRPPEFAQVRVPCVSDAIQPSHPLTSSSPSALRLSQHQGLCQFCPPSATLSSLVRCLHLPTPPWGATDEIHGMTLNRLRVPFQRWPSRIPPKVSMLIQHHCQFLK